MHLVQELNVGTVHELNHNDFSFLSNFPIDYRNVSQS